MTSQRTDDDVRELQRQIDELQTALARVPVRYAGGGGSSDDATAVGAIAFIQGEVSPRTFTSLEDADFDFGSLADEAVAYPLAWVSVPDDEMDPDGPSTLRLRRSRDGDGELVAPMKAFNPSQTGVAGQNTIQSGFIVTAGEGDDAVQYFSIIWPDNNAMPGAATGDAPDEGEDGVPQILHHRQGSIGWQVDGVEVCVDS